MDVVIVNLEECGRMDLGRYAIIATGQTESHCGKGCGSRSEWRRQSLGQHLLALLAVLGRNS